MIDGMLGKEISVSSANAMTSADTIGGALAVYVDDSNRLGAVAGWDLRGAANIGAAVALVPVGAAEDAVEDKYLPDNLLENLGEVSNVLASVFQIPGNPHLRLSMMHRPINGADNDAINLLYALGNRIDLSLDIPKYGGGRLAISLRF
ncbi:MAG: hypothetical protein ABI382_03250 [Nakamurella sp.]